MAFFDTLAVTELHALAMAVSRTFTVVWIHNSAWVAFHTLTVVVKDTLAMATASRHTLAPAELVGVVARSFHLEPVL